jgi:hypothetical protein
VAPAAQLIETIVVERNESYAGSAREMFFCAALISQRHLSRLLFVYA